MELKDTVDLMNSEDYKERFKAEYLQTKIRYDNLHKMLVKKAAGTLDFEPTCSTALLTEQKQTGTLADIRTMSQKAGVMVKRAIFAYVNRDTEAAAAVVSLDDEIDQLFRTIKSELVELIVENRQEADQAIDLIIIAKYLERIADHAVNIAQWAIFCVTGEIQPQA